MYDYKPVIKKTIKILNKDGWCQGSFTAPDGSHCLMGAIILALGTDFRTPNTKTSFWKPFFEKIEGKSITAWNDDPTRTKEDVLNLLKEVMKT